MVPLGSRAGLRLAQYNLGAMYANGQGVPQDAVQAYAWLNIAAAQGDIRAKEAKEAITRDMLRADISTAQRLAKQYWEKYVLPFRN